MVTLNLQDNEDIGVEGFCSIIKSLLSNTVLNSLNLSNTVPSHISERNQKQLGRLFQPLLTSTAATLQELIIVNAGLGDAFILEFAKALRQNCTLRLVSLGGKITNVGIAALSTALKDNKRLSTLYLQGSQSITDEGIILLFEALQYNSAIRSIDLRYKHIQLTNTVTQSILDALEYNDTIVDLTLHVTIDGSYRIIKHFESISTVLKQNDKRSRVAPKKGMRQREVIYRMLVIMWIYL
jgi:hypothetical protein